MKRRFSEIRRFIPFLLFLALCLTLLILHGLKKFHVDYVSIALLLLLAIPIIGEFIESIKLSGNEIVFKEKTTTDKIFILLESISGEADGWTFYPPRQGESNLGHGLGILIKNLLQSDREKMINTLLRWIRSDNKNTKWFAAEIIGYFRIEELKLELPKYFENVDKNIRWEYWRLNCLWAYSRFNNYQELGKFLIETTDVSNQLWIIQAIKQMIDTENNKKIFEAMLATFAGRTDISKEMKIEASFL